MIMYKLQPHFNIDGTRKVDSISVINLTTNTFIPFDPANTDYQNFKAQINADEAQLEDADGNVMSDAKAYVATLP